MIHIMIMLDFLLGCKGESHMQIQKGDVPH
jgi:hypothetical protein